VQGSTCNLAAHASAETSTHTALEEAEATAVHKQGGLHSCPARMAPRQSAGAHDHGAASNTLPPSDLIMHGGGSAARQAMGWREGTTVTLPSVALAPFASSRAAPPTHASRVVCSSHQQQSGAQCGRFSTSALGGAVMVGASTGGTTLTLNEPLPTWMHQRGGPTMLRPSSSPALCGGGMTACFSHTLAAGSTSQLYRSASGGTMVLPSAAATYQGMSIKHSPASSSDQSSSDTLLERQLCADPFGALLPAPSTQPGGVSTDAYRQPTMLPDTYVIKQQRHHQYELQAHLPSGHGGEYQALLPAHNSHHQHCPGSPGTMAYGSGYAARSPTSRVAAEQECGLHTFEGPPPKHQLPVIAVPPPCSSHQLQPVHHLPGTPRGHTQSAPPASATVTTTTTTTTTVTTGHPAGTAQLGHNTSGGASAAGKAAGAPKASGGVRKSSGGGSGSKKRSRQDIAAMALRADGGF
jgi:hypothetical protein